jgi:hypothetical protein
VRVFNFLGPRFSALHHDTNDASGALTTTGIVFEMLAVEDGTIFFNPGSATDRHWRPHLGVGLIHVTNPRDLINVRP